MFTQPELVTNASEGVAGHASLVALRKTHTYFAASRVPDAVTVTVSSSVGSADVVMPVMAYAAEAE